MVRDRFEASAAIVLLFVASAGCGSSDTGPHVPADIQGVFNGASYKNAPWGLRVVDLQSGNVLIDLDPTRQFFIGSVRKIFSVGELLNQVGPSFTYDTPVIRQGQLDGNGVLHGDVILVASGDLTMGGRTKPDGTIAVSDYDHNEADSLGNAVLTTPDPLAGYKALAQQVASVGIKEVTGEVIIDDRLFQPFNFRNEFDVRPIFVNDDVVDVTINPTTAASPASVVWRPVSAALQVHNTLTTGIAGTESTLHLDPEFPPCIGQAACTAEVTGQLPIDLVPPLTGQLPLVQTFRITQPSNYARTVFIEALQAAGVKIDAAATVAVNPVERLPPRSSYAPETRLAQLKGSPYSDDAKLILKVSYNIGADTSLVLYGLTQGVDSLPAALQVEKDHLTADWSIPAGEFSFLDGSGGGNTTSTNRVVTQMLVGLNARSTSAAFFDALPILGVDGSLAFVTEFESDPTLAGAKAQVRAKTGTFVAASDSGGMILKGQALAGYVDAKSGRRLAFQLVVNDVSISSLNDVIKVFQDQGTISATLWREY